MKLSTAKKYRRRHRLISTLLTRNPVLVMGLDLPFVIAAATSLKNAVAMAIVIFLIHVVTMLVGMFTRRTLPNWLRMMVNTAVATGVMVASRQLIVLLFQGVSNSLGMYLYLLAVNSMTLFQAAGMDKRAKLWPVLTGALSNAAAFSLVAVLTALIREYFGAGTIWGFPVPVPVRMSGLLIPFGGFVVVGFLFAFSRFLNKRLLGYSLAESARREEEITRIRIDSVEDID